MPQGEKGELDNEKKTSSCVLLSLTGHNNNAPVSARGVLRKVRRRVRREKKKGENFLEEREDWSLARKP